MAPKRDLYRDLYPDTLDRLIFVDAQPPEDDAAFTVLNDPVADGDRIRELVAMGYLVRTRTDADTVEARSGDTTAPRGCLRERRPARQHRLRGRGPALARLRHRSARRGAARCNPVSAPDDCDDAALADG